MARGWNMSRDVEPYRGADPGEMLPYVPTGTYVDRQDWTALRPPANTRTQEAWSKIATPFRGFLLFLLWLTYAWWRPVIAALIMATLFLLIMAISG